MTAPTPSEATVAFLRHTLATLAYRCGKAVRGAPESFGTFRIAPTTRTPVQILAHVGDLLEWAVWLLRGEHRWSDSTATPLSWPGEVERFFRLASELDAEIAASSPADSAWSLEHVFQGPVADALTHVGQLTLMRRLAGDPVRGENYARAEIVIGRTGAEQAAPRREFD
jgi:hypothetical protein